MGSFSSKEDRISFEGRTVPVSRARYRAGGGWWVVAVISGWCCWVVVGVWVCGQRISHARACVRGRVRRGGGGGRGMLLCVCGRVRVCVCVCARVCVRVC